jgi:hypothetical protein
LHVSKKNRTFAGLTKIVLSHTRTQRSLTSKQRKTQSKQQKNMYTNREKIEWTLIFVYEFGRRYGLTTKQAFNYLKRYKGIDFVDRHYDYVHTQSFESMINDISEYCRLKGGMLQ